MKRLVYILILLATSFVVAHAATGDSYVEKQQQLLEQPRTVLREARHSVGEALRKGHSAELVDALMQLSAAQLLIDSDSIATVVAEVEQTMGRCTNEVDRSVIALYLSSLYRGYANDCYHLRRRPYIAGNKDINTWSYSNYINAADSLLLVAAKPVDLLKQTPIRRYRSVIQIDGYNGVDAWRIVERSMPTMYDFVAEQIYTNGCYDSEREDTIRQLLDDVIAFHNQRKEWRAAFAWQLKRVQLGTFSAKDYAQTIAPLDSLIICNARHDYVIDAVIVRDNWLAYDDAPATTQHRYDELQTWIARYPRYYRIGCLRSACAAMAQAVINVKLPLVNYPDVPVVVSVEYKNVDKVQYRLEQIDGVMFDRWGNTPKRAAGNVTTLCADTVQLRDGELLTFDWHQGNIELPKLAAGVYRLVVYAGAQAHSECNFVVTPYMLFTVQPAADHLMAVLVDNKSGQPVEDVAINLLDNRGSVLQQVPTDSLGISVFTRSQTHRQLYVQLADSNLYPIKLSTDFYAESTVDAEPQATIFTDRSLYRPGQKLYFSAVVYYNDSKAQQVVPDARVRARLLDHSHNEVWSDTLCTNCFGMVNDSIILPENAALGSWRLILDGDKLYTSRTIEVAEYKRPQFRVVCNPIEGEYTYGDSVQVTGMAESYAAVPLRYAAVSYKVRQITWYLGHEKVIDEGKTTTDENGKFAFNFKTLPPDDSSWRKWGSRYVVEATVTSSTGESQRGETVVSVMGTAISFRYNIPETILKEDATPFAVTITNSDGTPLQLAMQLSLYQLDNGKVDEPFDRWQVHGGAVWSHRYTHASDSILLPYAQLPSGAYRLYFTTRDRNNEIVTDSTHFVLYSYTDTAPPVPTALWCPTNKVVVDNGDTARIVIGSSFHDASLLYIVQDGNRVLACRRVAMNNSLTTIEIPYQTDYTDVLQVQLVLVRDKVLYEKRVGIYRRQPDKTLTIIPTTFRDKTQSGSRETWQFSVRDALGNPVDALFMAEMYDASLDALHRHSWYFNPQYTPQRPYVSLQQMWSFSNLQHAGLYYWNTPYSNMQCHQIPTPRLATYIYAEPSIGIVGRPIMVRGSNAIAYEEYAAAPMMTKATSADMDAVATEAIVEESAVDALPQSAPAEVPISYRENMNETAFFYPHLVTDPSGNVVVKFTVPESNTTWNFFSLAFTPDLYSGMHNAQVVSSKPLMVSPNMPRFLRQGDHATISMSVQNTTKEALQGTARLTLFAPASESEIITLAEPFKVAGDSSATVTFALTIPDTLSMLGVRVGASTPLYSDGEQHLMAVLPSTAFVTESCPFYLAPTTSDTTITFDVMRDNMERTSVQNYGVTLEYCDNAMWYAVAALPPLAEPEVDNATSIVASLYANVVAQGIVRQNPIISQAIASWSKAQSAVASPLQQNEELKSILLSQTPWLLDAQSSTEQLQQLATLLDTCRANTLLREAVKKLSELQHTSGGWSWFKDMQPSYWMTLNVVSALSRLSVWGETDSDEKIAMMTIDALRYLDNEYVRRNTEQPRLIDYNDICYLYVRSAFTDIPLNDKVLAIHRAQLDTLSRSWYKLDEIEKAYTAIAMHRYGYSAAVDIIGSLREYATINPSQGMFWANNRSYSFYRNSAVQVHCAIYEAFAEIAPEADELDAMRQWLLLQKQTNRWCNVPSTLDAINILLNSGSQWLAQGSTSRIQWGGTLLPQDVQADAITGYIKSVRRGAAITPADATVAITHHDSKPSWGALYWQYYDSLENISQHGNAAINIRRDYYVERDGKLLPIDAANLQVGDVVSVRLTLYVDRDMQFITLTDARPACFEPLEQLPRYYYGDAAFYYAVPSDAANNFYFDHISRGTHAIEYRVYVDRAGTYRAGLATLQSYYAPQYVAHTRGCSIYVED